MPTLEAIARRQARSYTYSFSMGIGDAWRVILPCYSYGQGGTSPYHEDFWQGGSHYNYGIGEPNYPVPSVQHSNHVLACTVSKDAHLLVIWFADGTTIAMQGERK